MDTLIALGSAASVLYGLYSLSQILVSLAAGDAARAELFGMQLYLSLPG
jgi:hypothetical protein